MSKDSDRKTKVVLKYIANHPGTSVYGIDLGIKKNKENKDINRIFISRRVNLFANKGFLRVQKGPRNASPSWLTIRGLIYALQNRVIEPKEAQDIEKKHKLEVPCAPHSENCIAYAGYAKECSHVKAFKDNHPEVFFKLLSHMSNILKAEKEDISMFSCLSAVLGSMYMYITDSRFRHQCYDEQNLDMGCAGMGDPDIGTGIFLSPLGETLLKMLDIDLPKGWMETIQKEE